MSNGQWHWNYPIMSLNRSSNQWLQDTPASLIKIYNQVQDYFGNFYCVRAVINGQNRGMDSGIHRDSLNHCDTTYLIYLNPCWEESWGGQTVFFENNEKIHEEYPEPGKLISYASDCYHQGLGPSINNILRISFSIQTSPAKYSVGDL